MQSSLPTTKLSSRGQIVIPESVRQAMGLEPGSMFVVAHQGDVVLLKRVNIPSLKDFDGWVEGFLDKAKDQATKACLTEKDIEDTVNRVRRKAKLKG